MTKIVKEINIKIANKLIEIFSAEIITKSMIYDLLDLKEKELEIELAEKDKQLEIMNEQCDGAIREILEQKLFKEDFKKMITTSYSSKGHTSIESWELKDNSLYDKLPSKDVK